MYTRDYQSNIEFDINTGKNGILDFDKLQSKFDLMKDEKKSLYNNIMNEFSQQDIPNKLDELDR